MEEFGTYKRVFYVPREFCIRPDWEQIIWDETLKAAHAAGKIPVGAIMIDTEDGPRAYPSQIQPDGTLVEHTPMRVVPLEQAQADMLLGQQPTIKITAEVMVGADVGEASDEGHLDP